MPRPTLSPIGRPLSFDSNGNVAPGEAGLDIPDWGLSNIGVETPAPRGWIEVDDLPSDCDDDDSTAATADDDDTAGDAIFTPTPRHTADQYSAMAKTAPTILEIQADSRWELLGRATEAVESHVLVTKFGFAPNSLIINVGTERPVAMGFEVLAVTLAACQAADELSELAGPLAVCQVLGWTALTPPALKSFGADLLFRHAAALQGRVSEIKAERNRPAPRQALSLSKGTPNRGGIRPRLALPTRSTQKESPMTQSAAARTATPSTCTPAAAPNLRLVPAPRPLADVAEVERRISDAQLAAIRLGSPGASQILKDALEAPTLDGGENLLLKAEAMLDRAAKVPLPAPRAPRRAPVMEAPPGFHYLEENTILGSLLRRARR